MTYTISTGGYIEQFQILLPKFTCDRSGSAFIFSKRFEAADVIDIFKASNAMHAFRRPIFNIFGCIFSFDFLLIDLPSTTFFLVFVQRIDLIHMHFYILGTICRRFNNHYLQLKYIYLYIFSRRNAQLSLS